MVAVSPTYEISIVLEASRDQALEIARELEAVLGNRPCVGAVAVRPLEPKPCRRSFRQLIARPCS